MTIYHWKALNWLLLVGFIVGIKFPKNGGCCVCCTFGMFPKNWFCWVELSIEPAMKLLFAWLLLICNEDGGDDNIGWIVGCAVFVGLCNFSWFIDSDGPLFFDFVDNKLSKSIFMWPAFDHVWPIIVVVEALSDWVLSGVWRFCGCNILLDGWRIFAAMEKEKFFFNNLAWFSLFCQSKQ